MGSLRQETLLLCRYSLQIPSSKLISKRLQRLQIRKSREVGQVDNGLDDPRSQTLLLGKYSLQNTSFKLTSKKAVTDDWQLAEQCHLCQQISIKPGRLNLVPAVLKEVQISGCYGYLIPIVHRFFRMVLL